MSHSADPEGRDWDGPTSRQLLFLTSSFWFAAVALAEMRSIVDHSVKLQLYTYLRILSAGVGSLECYLLHLFARATARRGMRMRGPAVLALAAVAGVFNLKAIDALQNLSAFPVSDYGLGWRVYNITYWCLLFMAWAAIYLALDYNRAAVVQERRARLLEQLAHDAQLRALRFQIDPHFLFNTLNSVSALMLEGRIADAEEMIERLSAFFRTTLVSNPRKDVPLADEIRLQQTYLDIERVRFPNLIVEVDVHPDARDILVPPLLLQPLVENAVKFAVASRHGGARVGIRVAQPTNNMLHIDVWDDGYGAVGPKSKGTGTGLSNVRERLMARFGNSASVEFRKRAPCGASVLLSIPLGALP